MARGTSQSQSSSSSTSRLGVARRQRLQACGDVVSAEGPQPLTPQSVFQGRSERVFVLCQAKAMEMRERGSELPWRSGGASRPGVVAPRGSAAAIAGMRQRRLGGGSSTANSSNLYSWDDRRGFLCFARQKPWRRGREVRSCHGGAEEAQNGTVTVKP
jgi:hypothetical protein